RSRKAPGWGSRSPARSSRSTAASSRGRAIRAPALRSRCAGPSSERRVSDGATRLVADDDPGLRESLQRTLMRAGYQVVLAPDGRAALDRIQGGGLDLILSDLKMPGLTGIELLRA